MSGTLLMVASSFNEQLLRTPRALGLHVALAAKNAPTDATLYDVHLPVDERDEVAVLSTVLEYQRRHGPVDAVASYHEGSIHVAARVAETLGLPGNSYDAALTMRNKHLTSQALSRAGVRSPKTALVHTVDQAVAVAPSIGYPLVAKPRSGGASQGVVKVTGPAELEPAIALISGLYDTQAFEHNGHRLANMCYSVYLPGTTGVILQEFVSGPEVAVDFIYGDDRYEVLAIHDKPQAWDERCFIERIYTTPSQLPESVQAAVIATALDGLRAVGATTGAAHVELRVSDDGPVLLEINGRLGGTAAFVQESIERSTSVWGPLEYLRVVLGERPDVRRKEPCTPAGFIGLALDRCGQIVAFRGEAEVRSLPGVLNVRHHLKVGDRVFVQYPQNPNVFFAHVLVEGPSHGALLATMQQVEEEFRPVVVPEDLPLDDLLT